MKALFDSNILIDFLQGRREAADELDAWDDKAISIVSWMEVMIGATADLEAPTRAFLAGFTLVQLDPGVAEDSVALRRRYRLKLPDAIIWACARRDGRTLITRDVKDFPVGDPTIRVPYGGPAYKA